MDMQAAAMAMLVKARQAQIKAGRREHVAFASVTFAAVHDAAFGDDFKTTPRAKRQRLGERACTVAMPRLRAKKNRAERIAARANMG